MGYSKNEILSKCYLAIDDVSTFYKKGFINYRGRTTDTNELYTELVSEFLCDNIEVYKAIPKIARVSTYKVDGHDGVYSESSNRIEEITAMQMINQCRDGSEYDHIGKNIDYQTPLKNNITDDAGKIDLLSVKDDTVFLLELKREDSNETMLRCVLEGYTYLKTLNHEKLVSDFRLRDIKYVKANPLVFREKAQWKEMQEDRPQLKKLIQLLDIVPFYIFLVNSKYLIRED